MTTSKKLLITDGLNLVRRIYEANLAPDSVKKVDGAVNASIKSLQRALATHKPTHAAAFFDAGGRTWRHALYPDYRKSRKPMPQVLRDGLPGLFVRMQEELRIPSRCLPGIEADDAFAQLALQWRAEFPEAPVVGLSTDKDLAQLIANGVQIYDHFKPEWRDDEWVMKKFGVPPAMLGDLLALTGDSSDDIPGVTKVGPKTAANLLLAYGSVSGVIAASAHIKGAVGERLRNPLEQANARISRELIAFKLDSDLQLSWDDCALT